MANQRILGLYPDPDKAAEAMNRLKHNGFPAEDLDIYTGSPFPEGTFGEHEPQHRLYVFPFAGAVIGFSLAMLVTIGTQISYPLITGGKPILSIPPMTIIAYEFTMLGAIIATVVGILFESRIPRRTLGVYDERITDGFIGIVVSCPAERGRAAEQSLRASGAVDIKTEA
ncbi:MAG: DUF3341 domain-containing protein [SAR202 cluster bacterium]|nr:DUF3341 domain-containing protein [SAR202 cluster bacterium]